MEQLKPLVIVLSRNYSTGLGVIRSLGAAGYNVHLIASTRKKGSSVIASASKYVQKSVEVVTPKIQGDNGTEIIDELMKYVGKYEEKMILFPVDDFTASVVDAHRDVLRRHFHMPMIMKEDVSINSLMDKTVQGKMAREAGLMTPFETLISLRDTVNIPDAINYPCFVKPLQSVSGQKTEMCVCDNVSELKQHLLKMQGFYKDRDVLVQDYLRIEKEYDLSGICVDKQIIIPAVIEKIKIAKFEQGVTMCGKIHPVTVLGEMHEKIVAFLQSIHYVGMFDMELNVCGNEIFFNEINFRSGGPNYSYFLNGVNLPDIFIKEITGRGHEANEEKMLEYGKTFVYEKVAWEDYINSYMKAKELRQCINNADYTLLADKNDPIPGKIFYKRIRLSALKHKIKNCLRRK